VLKEIDEGEGTVVMAFPTTGGIDRFAVYDNNDKGGDHRPTHPQAPSAATAAGQEY
jgi:hypothetical protein